MPGFRNIRELVDAEEEGRVREYCFRKVPNVGTSSGYWFDLSMSPGNPAPNYYAATPEQSKALRASTNGGIFVGKDVAPYKKYLRHLQMSITNGALLAPYYLLDYLLFYPFLAEDTLDEQPLTQVDALPRYTDGDGVRIMIVSLGSRVGGQTFRVGYTNQAGVSGRYTSTIVENATVANGNILSSNLNVASATGPFLCLQAGDTGVRQLDSFQMISGVDVGLVALVLVKPIASVQCYFSGVVSETDFLLHKGTVPEIKDDAYLNFILGPYGSISNYVVQGTIKVVYN